MLLALVMPAHAGLLINEVVYDPASSDDGLEWVELCNDGTDTIDLAGYTLENAGSSWTEVYTLATESLAPGAYVIVGYGGSANAGSFDPNLQNGGSDTDGLRLKDASGTVIDTVLYDEPNTNALTEDDGTTPSAGAGSATSGKSIGRYPNCADTNVSATDFQVFASADVTPGAENVVSSGGGDDTGTPPSDVDCSGSEHVVVNELMPNPDGSDSGAEWLELTNTGSTTATLDGWVIEYGTGGYDDHSWTFPDGTTLAPGAYVVVGSGGLDASLSLGNASSNADGLRLTCDGAAVDSVIYGASNDDGFTDDSGAVASSLAPEPTEGESIQRVPDGYDSDTCAVDFTSCAASPGAENTCAPVGNADCTGSESVVINELAYTTDAEWVELYNGGSASVTLDGWIFEFGTSSYSKEAEIVAGTTLAPGEWLVFGSAGATTKDVELDMDLGNASNTDALRLTCNGAAVDTVVYGDPNDDAWADDSGATASSFAPEHGDGESLARVEDGYDTDQCGVDFVVSESPTPGASNPVVEPPVCEALGSIVLNEFIYNPSGTDTDNEWIELTNTGDAAVRLDAWSIEGAGASWSEKYTFPTGATIDAGEYLLVGGPNTDAAYVADSLSIDNASSGAGGLRLVDCEANVIDSVLYGADEIEDDITGDNGSTEIVPETGEGASLGRWPNGEDNDAAADWYPYAAPTPGDANTDPGAAPDDTGGGPKTPGGGCGGNGAPPDPDGGCAVALPLSGWEVAIAALALLRRRA